MATQRGDKVIVASLVLAGGDPNLPDKGGVTSKDMASTTVDSVFNMINVAFWDLQNLHPSLYEVPKKLILGSPFYFAEKLCDACWKGSFDTVKDLLLSPTYKEVLDLENERGQNSLYCASRQGHVNIVVHLLLAGANVNFQVKSHRGTPLHAASFANHVEVFAALLVAGANPNLPNAMGTTAKDEVQWLFSQF